MVNRLFQHIRGINPSVLLLVLFIEYVASVTMFTHSHIIDGDVVFHSHLYADSAEAPSHSHSSQQVKVIAQLSLYVAVAATVSFAVGNPIYRFLRTVIDSCYETLQRCDLHFSLRAPPVVIES